MRIWLAGVPGAPEQSEKSLDRLNRLYSLFDLLPFNGGGRLINIFPEKLNRMKKADLKVDLFLDSGAFSAWTQGAHIDIQEYIKFIEENKKVIGLYANLDVIKIKDPSNDKKWIGPNRRTAELTLDNQNIMEEAGLTPLPCFHFGEPMEYLQYYVDNYSYMALGVAGNSGLKLMPWLDDCFQNYICDESGMPKIKVHGFAVTSLRVMIRYPWYSVDSTSWVVTGRMGGIYVPNYRNGIWLYDENSEKISVSDESPNLKERGKHINTMPKHKMDIILNYIHEKGFVLGSSEFKTEDQDYQLKENEKWVGKKPVDKSAKRKVKVILEPGLSNQYQLRDQLNILYFIDLENNIQKWPWAFTRQSHNGLGI